MFRYDFLDHPNQLILPARTLDHRQRQDHLIEHILQIFDPFLSKGFYRRRQWRDMERPLGNTGSSGWRLGDIRFWSATTSALRRTARRRPSIPISLRGGRGPRCASVVRGDSEMHCGGGSFWYFVSIVWGREQRCVLDSYVRCIRTPCRSLPIYRRL